MGIEVSITGSGNTAVAIPGPFYERRSQSFPSGSGFDLQSISLKLALGVGAPGDVDCNIYAVDGNDLPIGLSLGTSSIAAATLNTFPSWSLRAFIFDPVVVLSASTQYCFVMSTDTGSWDVNYAYIGTNGGDSYADGIMGGYDGSWAVLTNTYPATIRSPSFIVYAEGTKTVTAAVAVTVNIPGKAKNPTPEDDEEGVLIRGSNKFTKLEWDASDSEEHQYRIYLTLPGVAEALVDTIIETQGSSKLAITLSDEVQEALSFFSINIWRVDTHDPDTFDLTVTGDTWTFITQQTGQYTNYTRRSDYDPDKVWQPGTGWVDPNTFEYTGGGRYKGRVLVIGHQVIYFGDL